MDVQLLLCNSLSGMPQGKSWVLYAPEGDTAIMRNWLAYGLWRQTGRCADAEK
jgi:hypothetical protein